MIKALLCLAVIVVCGLIGRVLSKRHMRRAELLSQTHMTLTALRDDITIKKLTLTDSMRGCARRYDMLSGLLESTAATLTADPTAGIAAAWEAGAAELAETAPADRKAVAEAGGDLEALCTAGDPARLEMRAKRMKDTAETLHIAAQSKGKAYTCVGVLAGIFISVLVY